MNITEDFEKEVKKLSSESSTFCIEKIEKVIERLKAIQHELKSQDIKINCTAIMKAIALQNCLREYGFHWDHLVDDMEKKGLIVVVGDDGKDTF